MDTSFKDKIKSLGTEQRNPATMQIDSASTEEMVCLINNENRVVSEAIGREAAHIAAAVDLITERIKRGGRLIYAGAGTSGRLGILDASECPPTFSVSPDLVMGIIAGGDIAIRNAVENSEDDPVAAGEQLSELGLSALDSVVAVSASGRTPYSVGALKYAKSVGAAAISVSNNAGSEMAAVSDVAIEAVTGPEALCGSTRLKAGTAQKVILNIISTSVMIKLGKTYHNLMVDVKATNKKLRSRCLNILGEIFGDRSADELQQALDAAGGSVKLAAVILKTGSSAAECEKLLAANGGFLKPILEG